MNKAFPGISLWRLLPALLFLFHSGPAVAETQLLRIGTGGKTGVYYPIGKLIAQGLTRHENGTTGIPGCIAVAQNSAGSVENVKTIAAGEIEAGLVQADIAAQAFGAAGGFTGKKSSSVIRAIASLYPEKFQIVVRRDAGVASVQELRGKRISLDEKGSGTLAVMRIILAAHSLAETDLKPVYLKPVFTEEKMVSGDLQGFVMMAGTPMEAVASLAHIGVTLVPVAGNVAEFIHRKYPFLVPGLIPAGVYGGVPETPTIQVHALLAVSDTMDENLAYQVTAALWSTYTLGLLKKGHAQGKDISLKTALSGISIPLHRGAERFYRENGMALPGAQVQ